RKRLWQRQRSRPALHRAQDHVRCADQVLDQRRSDARRLPRPRALGPRGNEGYRLLRYRRAERLSALWKLGRGVGRAPLLLRHRIPGVERLAPQRRVYRCARPPHGVLIALALLDSVAQGARTVVVRGPEAFFRLKDFQFVLTQWKIQSRTSAEHNGHIVWE